MKKQTFLKLWNANWDGIHTLAGFILFSFFGGAAEFRLDFEFRSMLDRISWRVDTK